FQIDAITDVRLIASKWPSNGSGDDTRLACAAVALHNSCRGHPAASQRSGNGAIPKSDRGLSRPLWLGRIRSCLAGTAAEAHPLVSQASSGPPRSASAALLAGYSWRLGNMSLNR